MFELKFGMLWEAFTLFVTILICTTSEFAIYGILITLIFHVIGIFLIYKGAKKVVKDKKTEKYGIECYGKVIEIIANGNSTNGRSELEACISVYMQSEGQTRELKEVVGLGESPYEAGDYLKLKYYNDDINIVEKVYPDYLPTDVRKSLEAVPTRAMAGGVFPDIVYESEDVIQVDGVRYQRIK